MKLRKVCLSMFVGYVLLLVSACSSDSGGETGTGATDKTVTGPITGFGSIYVNGIKFNTDNANIVFDDAQTTEDDLAVGMIVTVNGTVNRDQVSGAAIEIVAETQVKGLVFSNTISQSGIGKLVVMGRTVMVTADTEFRSKVPGISLTDIGTQTVVQVSGYSDNVGNIHATFLKVTGNDGNTGEIKVKGIIAELSLSSRQFKIDQFTVSFDDDTEFSEVEKEDLRNGMFVKVKSERYNAMDSNPHLLAAKIELEGHDDEDGDEVKKTGLVTNVDNMGDGVNGEFELSGQLVRVDANTSYEKGGKSNIVLGAILEVEGEVAAGGVIIAEEIEFEKERDDRDSDED